MGGSGLNSRDTDAGRDTDTDRDTGTGTGTPRARRAKSPAPGGENLPPAEKRRHAPESFADPSRQSHWRPLRLLQAAMDAEIARVYAEARIDGLKPAWVMELLRLHANGPMTITELAASVQRTHSAVS